ncbi:adenylate/guanylate cyclase domain-containing protein [Candidatus Micrarchaeota archaeon]|nr:adenylate/guanylate cyclase domain-containing protein [Candidatus Micrarchaeota archaeon]
MPLLSSVLYLALSLLGYGLVKSVLSFRANRDLPHFLWLSVLLIAAFGLWLELFGGVVDALIGKYRILLALGPLAMFLAYYYWGNKSAFYQKQSSQTNDFFKYYLSPQVISDLQEKGYVPIGGQKRQVSILVTDVRNSTGLCISHPPETVVRSLNQYFEVVTTAVTRHGGTVDKLTGDGVMAMFNAPQTLEDHTSCAFEAARDIQINMKTVNAKLASGGLPELNVGVGIDTGVGIVGNIGSKHMVRYTVIGDVANTASRIQEYANAGEVVLTGSAFKLLSKKVPAATQTVNVRGKGPLVIYKVNVA